VHDVTFPAEDVPVLKPPPTPTTRVRGTLSRLKRTVLGAPVMYRPTADDMRQEGGVVDRLVRDAIASTQAEAAASVNAAGNADVLFTHEAAVAEQMLSTRREGQQVWLMLHSPMPLGLYLGWNWGVPEWAWADVAALPDTRRWAEWEAGLCRAVDRVIIPCAEAVDELVKADAAFLRMPRVDYVLTGASAPTPAGERPPRAELRRRWNLPDGTPVGLYLGTRQAYRGFDVLMDAVHALPSSVRGLVAVAGPSPDAVPSHERVRALGMVREVGDLLQAVDFVINVNRFSLFDLSVIEAAEAGRPLLLHAIGGNRWFESHGLGCVPIPDVAPATVTAGLSDLFSMPDAERRTMGDASRRCYDEYLTRRHMWRGHCALYDLAAEQIGAASTR
jgi:glycosyltransferase involved in cell wall biosynthesis